MKWRKVLIVILLGVFLYSSYEIFSYLYVSHKEKSTYDNIIGNSIWSSSNMSSNCRKKVILLYPITCQREQIPLANETL
jgi:hypothetical protein